MQNGLDQIGVSSAHGILWCSTKRRHILLQCYYQFWRPAIPMWATFRNILDANVTYITPECQGASYMYGLLIKIRALDQLTKFTVSDGPRCSPVCVYCKYLLVFPANRTGWIIWVVTFTIRRHSVFVHFQLDIFCVAYLCNRYSVATAQVIGWDSHKSTE